MTNPASKILSQDPLAASEGMPKVSFLNKPRLLAKAKKLVALGPGASLTEVAMRAANLMGEDVPATRADSWRLIARMCGVTTVPLTKGERRARKKEQRAHPNRSRKNAALYADDFLGSYAWRKLRMVVIKQRGARCECCGATPADGETVINVDHIKPRKLYPELALVESNLQVLCNACNHGKGNWDQTDWRTAPAPGPRLVKATG